MLHRFDKFLWTRIGKLTKKLLFSPFLFFLISFFYFDRSFQKASLSTLYFIIVVTSLVLITKIWNVVFSGFKLNLFRTFKGSFEIVVVIFGAVAYTISYIVMFGMEFSL
ncbi:MAG TPA: hypothetical protein VGA67_03275 [Candidatus Dojkabacteria bacterium]|jgi:hypothetical protein